MTANPIIDRWINERKDLLTLRHVVDNDGYFITLASITAPKEITRERFNPNALDAMRSVTALMERVGGTWERVTA